MASWPESERLDRIYEAGVAPERFPAVLQCIAAAFSADAANCNVLDPHLENANLCFVHGIPEDAMHSYAEYYGERDEWRRGAHARPMTPGRVYLGSQLVSDAALARSEFQSDYLSDLDLFHWCGARIATWDDGQAVISLQRARRRDAFSAEDVERFQSLVPHLRRVVLVVRRLAAARQEALVLRETIANDPVGIVVVDASGRVVGTNARGESLLRDGHALVLRGDRIGARRTGDEARLLALIATVGGHSPQAYDHAGTGIALPRLDSPRPLLVTAMPVPQPEAAFMPASGRQVVLHVVDPDLRTAPPSRVLMAWFGLTVSEARLAHLLADGESLASAASALGVTLDSARQYLKRVFRKTGCHRQAELVRILSSARGVRWEAKEPAP